MIPGNENYEDFDEDEQDSDFEDYTEPSYTYAMKMTGDEAKEDSFVGKVDDTEAMQQAVMKILTTERYEHEIYSWDFGIETKDLYGMDILFVMSELKTRIEDAITADDRFESVDDYFVEKVGKNIVHCTFTVTTAGGEQIGSEYDFDMTGG